MDINILCQLLVQQIQPDKFQLRGETVHWMSEDYNTPENQAIVADVIANYPALEAVYLAEQQVKIITAVNSEAIKMDKVNRLLKKGLIAKAIKEQGGL